MSGLLKTDRNKIFWVLHISGWSAMVAFLLFGYSGSGPDQNMMIAHYTLRYLMGFIACLFLAYFYKELNFRTQSAAVIIFYLTFIFITGTHLWYVLERIKDFTILANQEGETSTSFGLYTHDLFWNSVYLLFWSAFYFSIRLWLDWTEQKTKSEKADILAKNAQLRMLRYQLNPHFLFNSLNSVRALVSEDENKAKNMINELIEFLKYSFNQKDYSDIPLKDELTSIKHYLAIEKVRYEEKLDILFQIDPAAEEYPVLSFLIHPLVENAVKHGMRTSSLPLKIEIKAAVLNNRLKLEVSNTGKWIEKENSKGTQDTGTGLNNVRLRLENAYPGKHLFKIEKQDEIIQVFVEILS